MAIPSNRAWIHSSPAWPRAHMNMPAATPGLIRAGLPLVRDGSGGAAVIGRDMFAERGVS
jgi:hypothetical protein